MYYESMSHAHATFSTRIFLLFWCGNKENKKSTLFLLVAPVLLELLLDTELRRPSALLLPTIVRSRMESRVAPARPPTGKKHESAHGHTKQKNKLLHTLARCCTLC